MTLFRLASTTLLNQGLRNRQILSRTSPLPSFSTPKRQFGGEVINIILGGAVVGGIAVGGMMGAGAMGLTWFAKRRSPVDQYAQSYFRGMRCPHLKKIVTTLTDQERHEYACLLTKEKIDITKIQLASESEAREWLDKNIKQAMNTFSQKRTI